MHCACVPVASGPPVASVPATQATTVEALRRAADPPEAEDGLCWARDNAPADTAQRPMGDGATASWFRYPCLAETEAEFIASTQRALAARDLYGGAASGEMNAATRTAIIAFQRPLGLRSGILSVAAARALGLVVWEPGASLWE